MAGSKDTFKSVIVLDENDIPGSILPRKSCLSAALSTQMTCPGPRIHTSAQFPTRFRSRQLSSSSYSVKNNRFKSMKTCFFGLFWNRVYQHSNESINPSLDQVPFPKVSFLHLMVAHEKIHGYGCNSNIESDSQENDTWFEMRKYFDALVDFIHMVKVSSKQNVLDGKETLKC